MIIPDDHSAVIEGLSRPFNPDTPKLLESVDNQSLEDLEILLKCGAPADAHGGSFNETPLHKAAKQGWVEGVRLLLSYGATGVSTNQFGQTALHYAAAYKSFACVRSLLESGHYDKSTTVDHKDMRGHTALHDAAAAGNPEGVTLLLRAGAGVEVKDNNEETPLYKAAKARCISSMLFLINKGADIGSRDKLGESVLRYVLRHVPAGMDSLLDNCLVAKQDMPKKLEVLFNFKLLTGNSDINQMRILNTIVELGHPKLLLHPLCEAFLLIKWHNVRKIFFIEVIFYFFHAILATVLILEKFVWQCLRQVDGKHEVNLSESDGCDFSWNSEPDGFNVLAIILYLQVAFILLKQTLTISQNLRTWILSLYHVLNGILPIMVLIVVPGDRTQWRHHLATITLLFIWVQCMLHIGRFPGCGIYVAMFTKVAKVFLRIFLIFFCLLWAFSMSFYISKYGATYSRDAINKTREIAENKEYTSSVMVFMKTLTMMMGELDFDSSFVGELEALPGTNYLIFLAFVILVAIILSNLLVALAVDDVQGLRNRAHLERLIKQMELVYQMEKTFATVAMLATCMNFKWISTKVLFFVHESNTKVFMLPHNPQKSSKLLVWYDGSLTEIQMRQSHVNSIMNRPNLKEIEPTNRKQSIRKSLLHRQIRTEYSTFATSDDDDDLRDTLKKIEMNVIVSMNERMDEMIELFTSLSNKIDKIEETLCGSIPDSGQSQQRSSKVNSVPASNGGLSLVHSVPLPSIAKSPNLAVRHSHPLRRYSPVPDDFLFPIAISHSRSSSIGETNEVAIEMTAKDKPRSDDIND